MNIPAFFANLFPTLFLAFVGTSLSAAAVAVLLYSAGWLGLCYPLTKLAALFFGSLISATDPVTVLAVFKAIGVRDDIFAIVFGESVLNDAVAIVLARTVLAFNTAAQVEVDGEGDSTSAGIGGAMVTFIVIFVGSMLIGVLAGMLCALTFKRMRLCDHEEKQVAEAIMAIMAIPYLSWLYHTYHGCTYYGYTCFGCTYCSCTYYGCTYYGRWSRRCSPSVSRGRATTAARRCCSAASSPSSSAALPWPPMCGPA